MSFKALAIFSVFAIPGILWLVQSIYLIYVAMGINMSGLTMVGVALLVGLLIPHMHYLTSWNKWLVSGASTILGLVFILQVALGSEFNERFPKPNTLFYAYNANSDETFWASTDQQLDSWTSQYIDAKTTDASLSEILPTSAVPMHRSPAPRIDIAAPKVDLLKDDSEGEVRTLQFRIASARHASYLNLFFHPESKIQEASINGMQVEGIVDLTNDALNNWWRWRYFGLPTEGVDLTLKVRSNEAIEIRAVDISYGLPRFTDASFKPRPDNMIPRRYTLSEMTIAARTYVFEGDSLSRATE